MWIYLVVIKPRLFAYFEKKNEFAYLFEAIMEKKTNYAHFFP